MEINTPIKGKWNLSKDDISYPFSSAAYYATGQDWFGFLHNIFIILMAIIFITAGCFVSHEPRLRMQYDNSAI
jgi:hypothetical protein